MATFRETGVVSEILELEVELTFTQICQACGAGTQDVVELVEEGLLEPAGCDEEHWRFPGTSLQRARKALRLQQDLGVNVAGAALALELIDELNRLKTKLADIE